MAQGFPVICYDFHAVSRFFRSVALAIAFQRHTRIEWETYRDSSVLNAVYTVMFWKEPPGTAEVRMASRRIIESTTDQLHQEFVSNWIDKLHKGGPAAGNEYVSRMATLRDQCREMVNDVFREASQINNEVINQTTDAIVALARIRLAATVGVAVIGGAAGVAFAAAAAGGGVAAGGLTVFGMQAGASATGFAAAGLGYSVTNSVVKNWEQGPGAKVAAVSMDVGKATASELGGKASEHMLGKALEQGARSSQIIRSAEGQLRKYSEVLAREGVKRSQRRKAQSIVQSSTQQIAAQSGRLAQATRMANVARGVGKGIPVVFAAWDIWDAFGDYGDTMKSVGR